MSQPKFDEAEFLRTLERLAADQGYGDWTPSAYDPKVARDARDEKLRGNKIGRYVQALEGLGLVLVPPQALGFWNDGRPHRESMWIHPDYDMQLAFTDDDVLQLFPGESGPEDLWTWVTQRRQRLAAQRAGLVLPA